MSQSANAEQESDPDLLYRHLRLVKVTLGIAATALTIGRLLGLL